MESRPQNLLVKVLQNIFVFAATDQEDYLTGVLNLGGGDGRGVLGKETYLSKFRRKAYLVQCSSIVSPWKVSMESFIRSITALPFSYVPSIRNFKGFCLWTESPGTVVMGNSF